MSDFTAFLLDKVALPVLSGAGGVALSIWRLQKSLSDRLEALELAWKQFNDKDYPRERGDFQAKFADQLAQVHAFLDLLEKTKKELEAKINDEVEDINKGLNRRSHERAETRKLQSRLSERYMALEGRMEKCEKSLSELSTQYQDFAKDQNEQWQTMNNQLGQLEGYLRGIIRSSDSGQFPGTKRT